MGQLGEAVVVVRPDLQPLDGGLKAAEGRVKSFVSAANLAMAGLAAAGGAAVGAALFDAAKKAADLGESVSKVKATFGGSAGSILKFADEMADRFGMVKQSSLDMATGLGLIGQAAGMSEAKAAELGIELTRLAADVSSFANVSMEDAAQALRSGLSGESEPLRRFGVFLTEDAVKNEAFRLGLTKTTGALTEQAKVLARLSLIKQSPAMQKAMGDLERTSDSAANQLRKFEGELANFKVEFGKNFIEPMTQGLQLAREFGTALGKATGGKEGESMGNHLGGIARAGRAILEAGNEGAAKNGNNGGLLSPIMKGVGFLAHAAREAFLPDQARADRLAGVAGPGLNASTPAPRPPTAMERFAAERAAYDARLQKDLANQREFAQSQKDADRRSVLGALGAIAKQKLSGLAGILSGDRTKSLPAQAQLGAPTTAGGKLALAGAAFVRRLNERAQRPQERFGSASVYSDGADFARSAAQQSLDYDPAKSDREKANELLEKISGGIEQLVKSAGEKAGAVLRGRS